MPTYLDNVPSAVATIVAATGGMVVGVNDLPNVKETKLVAYIEKVTRLIASAMVDANLGEPLGKKS